MARFADPRADNARHDFLEVVFIALAAVLCGAEDCTDMAMFARSKLELLKQVLKLAHGPPSHDTFSRVFRLIAPEPFEAAFAKFTAAFAGALKGVVAIDGKALRGAYERGRKATPLHLVNVWAAEARLVIGQRLAPGRNEVLGAQQALALLRSGRLHRHRRRPALPGRHRPGDPRRRRRLRPGGEGQPARLAGQGPGVDRGGRPSASKPSRGPAFAHDRVEGRTALVVPATGMDFPGLAAVARVETHRKNNGEPEPVIVRFFLLSTLLTSQRMLQVARAHWTIENQLHWVLDVAFDEDAVREAERTTPLRTSPSSESSPSTSSASIPTRDQSRARSSAPDGTTPSSSRLLGQMR